VLCAKRAKRKVDSAPGVRERRPVDGSLNGGDAQMVGIWQYRPARVNDLSINLYLYTLIY
jgi:hypothetical protein